MSPLLRLVEAPFPSAMALRRLSLQAPGGVEGFRTEFVAKAEVGLSGDWPFLGPHVNSVPALVPKGLSQLCGGTAKEVDSLLPGHHGAAC